MAIQTDGINQLNQFYKIIKENLLVTLTVIIKEALVLDIPQHEESPNDIQYTTKIFKSYGVGK